MDTDTWEPSPSYKPSATEWDLAHRLDLSIEQWPFWFRAQYLATSVRKLALDLTTTTGLDLSFQAIHKIARRMGVVDGD